MPGCVIVNTMLTDVHWCSNHILVHQTIVEVIPKTVSLEDSGTGNMNTKNKSKSVDKGLLIEGSLV